MQKFNIMHTFLNVFLKRSIYDCPKTTTDACVYLLIQA